MSFSEHASVCIFLLSLTWFTVNHFFFRNAFCAEGLKFTMEEFQNDTQSGSLQKKITSDMVYHFKHFVPNIFILVHDLCVVKFLSVKDNLFKSILFAIRNRKKVRQISRQDILYCVHNSEPQLKISRIMISPNNFNFLSLSSYSAAGLRQTLRTCCEPIYRVSQQLA